MTLINRIEENENSEGNQIFDLIKNTLKSGNQKDVWMTGEKARHQN